MYHPHEGTEDTAVFYESDAADALQELEHIFEQYDEEITLEVAEETYHDLMQGDVSDYTFMTFYTDRSLEELKTDMPGSVFSRLPDDYDRYSLVHDDATIELVFDESHDTLDAGLDIDDEFDYVEIRIPEEEAVFRKLFRNVKERLRS